MKKLFIPILLLSVLGAIASFILLIQHYNPAVGYKIISCGVGRNNPCHFISQSAYGKLFGFSTAAFGVLFYIYFIAASIFGTLSQKDNTRNIIIAFLFPLIVLGLLIDIRLFSILISLKKYCNLCITTYILNALIFIAVSIYIVLLHKSGTSIIALYKNILGTLNEKITKNAVIVMIAFGALSIVLSLSSDVVMKKSKKSKKEGMIKAKIEEFYNKPKITMEIPQSLMVIGDKNAVVRIDVFSDYLCSACNYFKKVEKQMLREFPGKVKFVYFNYPLDQECNKYMTRKFHIGACKMAKAAIATYKLKLFKGFTNRHLRTFRQKFRKLRHQYADVFLYKYMDESGLTVQQIKKMKKIMNSPATLKIIEKEIEIAHKLRLRSTPTLFINNRIVKGAMRPNILRKIIKLEIEGKGNY